MEHIAKVLEEVRTELMLVRHNQRQLLKIAQNGSTNEKLIYTTLEVAEMINISKSPKPDAKRAALMSRVKRGTFPQPDFKGRPNKWYIETIEKYLSKQ